MEKQNMRTFLLDAVLGVGFSGYSFRGGGIKSSFSRENNRCDDILEKHIALLKELVRRYDCDFKLTLTIPYLPKGLFGKNRLAVQDLSVDGSTEKREMIISLGISQRIVLVYSDSFCEMHVFCGTSSTRINIMKPENVILFRNALKNMLTDA